MEIISLSGESFEKTSGACWTRSFSDFFSQRHYQRESLNV